MKREEVFITSKLWNTERGYDKAIASFNKTLENLETDYLDLFLIHWPANEKQFGDEANKINLDTWRAFEDLYKEGKIRAIGVSNFMPNHLEYLLENAEIKPMVNQIEVHPGWPQTEAIRYCQRHDILVEAWAPLGEAAALSNEVLQRIAKNTIIQLHKYAYVGEFNKEYCHYQNLFIRIELKKTHIFLILN